MITIVNTSLLFEYINGVMGRADHHGENVNEVVLGLAGAVVWKATEDIEVREYDGHTANILWFKVGEKKYAFTFNHADETIELHERVHNGTVIAVFDNATTNADIKRIFLNL